nr:putative ribonuclease H-like domain-containing protein [Tanacetum cinerariifolium]
NTDADDMFEVKKPKSKVHVSLSSSDKTKKHDDKTKREAKGKSHVELSIGVRNLSEEFEDFSSNITNGVNAASTPVTAVEPNSTNSTNTFSAVGPSNNAVSLNFEFGGKSSFMDPSQYLDDPDMPIWKQISLSVLFQHLEFTNIILLLKSLVIYLQLLKQGRVHQALKDPSWIESMQEKLLQFKMQMVWVLVYLPKGKRAIGSKWVFRNKKDERGVVVRNKARLFAQGHTREEGIDYEEVFAPIARIEAIRLFLAYVSFMGFMVYQMDVKSAFLYGTIEKEGLQVKQKEDGIFISQDKYAAEILRKFGLTDGKSASTPIDTEKPLLKDPDGEDIQPSIWWHILIVTMLVQALIGSPQQEVVNS